MPERSAAGSPGVGRPLAGRAGTSGAPQARFPAPGDFVGTPPPLKTRRISVLSAPAAAGRARLI